MPSKIATEGRWLPSTNGEWLEWLQGQRDALKDRDGRTCDLSFKLTNVGQRDAFKDRDNRSTPDRATALQALLDALEVETRSASTAARAARRLLSRDIRDASDALTPLTPLSELVAV